MKRVKHVLMYAMPTLVVGGLIFGNTFGHAAADDRDLVGYWPAASDNASSNAAKRRLPPAHDPWAGQPVPPAPPVPPVPPVPPGRPVGGGGVSIHVNGNQVRIDGIDTIVQQHLDAVRRMLDANPNIPPDVRARINGRMSAVKSIIDKRLKNLKTSDLDQLEAQLEQMGEELETAMEGLDEDLSQLGDKLSRDVAKSLGKDFAKQFKHGKWKLDLGDQHDDDADDDADDDDHDSASLPGIDDDDDTVAVDTLKGVTITKSQRDQIRQLRASSDAQISEHRKQLDEASIRLETALADPKTSDADIARYVDQISMHEAAIRKARLLTWVNARRMLDPDQVRKIEDAARKRSR